jgi:Ca2+-binding EF-hand superfamily protein
MLDLARQFSWQQASRVLGRTVSLAFLLPLFAAATAPDERPINVVGHAWAPFISPMGEPFRPRTASDDTLARWFHQADRNHDGRLTPDEMQADADRFFALLDIDHDGVIGPDELIQYEWELAPDIQLSSKLKRLPGEAAAVTEPAAETDQEARRSRRQGGDPDWVSGGLQGAARYGLLNMPEPVAAADANFDRAITKAEFEAAALARFQLLDRDHRGALTLDVLEAAWTSVLADLHQHKHRADETDTRVGAPLPPDR